MTEQIQQTISNAIDIIYTKLYNDCLNSLDDGYAYDYKYNSTNIPIVTNNDELNQLTLSDFHNGLIQYQDKMVHVISTHEMFSRLLKDLPKEFRNLVLRKNTLSSDINTITFSVCNEFKKDPTYTKWPTVRNYSKYFSNQSNYHYYY